MIQPNATLKFLVLATLAFPSTGCGRKEGASAPSAESTAIPPPVSSREVEPAMPPGHPPISQAGSQGTIPPPPAGSGEGATGLSWAVPESWSNEPPSSNLRRAQYKVPGPGGDGECAVFYFGPGQGGSVEANVERWASQFTTADGHPGSSAVKTTTTTVGDLRIVHVEVAGTYNGGSSMGMAPAEPRPGYKLLGAIVEGADANWFFKLTGPETTIEANRAAFDGMIQSMRRGA